MANTLLVYIEDDPMSRDVMSMLITTSMSNTEVIIFSDSEDFIAKLDGLSQHPDVIMLDIHVDPYDGFTMLSKLRQTETYKDTKIIALTASVMNEEVKRLRKAGFDGVIGKPIDQVSFPDCIERVLAGEAVWHIM